MTDYRRTSVTVICFLISHILSLVKRLHIIQYSLPLPSYGDVSRNKGYMFKFTADCSTSSEHDHLQVIWSASMLNKISIFQLFKPSILVLFIVNVTYFLFKISNPFLLIRTHSSSELWIFIVKFCCNIFVVDFFIRFRIFCATLFVFNRNRYILRTLDII